MRIFDLKISLSNEAESLPPASLAVAVDVSPGTGQAPPSVAGPEPKTEPSRPDRITAVSSIGAPSRASTDSLLELEASNSEEHHYAERYAGRVLSAPGQEFQVAEPVQRVLALVESRYLLVSRDDPLHAAVWSFRERLDRAGHVLSRILYVEPATLLSLYRRHHDRVVARGAGVDARPRSEAKTEPSRPDRITAVSSIGAPSRASTDSPLELEASSSEEHHYAERYAGRVLSAPGQEFQVAEPVQRVLALVESGCLLVSRDDPLHAAVWSLRERLDRAGHVLSRILYVEPATLLSLYRRHHDRVVGSRRRGSNVPRIPESEIPEP